MEGLCPLLNKECEDGIVEAKRCHWYDDYNNRCSIKSMAIAIR